jgi:hypothetical protein
VYEIRSKDRLNQIVFSGAKLLRSIKQFIDKAQLGEQSKNNYKGTDYDSQGRKGKT